MVPDMPMPITDKALLRLLTWLSPSFPVGAYAYSHGAEAAVEQGWVADFTSATEWIGFVLEYGSGRVDAGLFVRAFRAVDASDTAAYVDVARWADALKGSAELGLESRAQGQAFFDAVLGAWPDRRLEKLVTALAGADVPPSYATAVAGAAACAGVEARAALTAYVHGFAANMTSAIVRLVPLGQSDGLKIIAALEPTISALATRTLDARATENSQSLGDIGSAAFMVDWLSMSHETQYSRLFRS